MKVSVVISAYNEEKKLADCLESIKEVADEIIVVNSGSTDKTEAIAKKYTDSVFTRENNQMLNVNKNFGFGKAKSEWILNLDADERLDKALVDEILTLPSDSSYSGYFIPRKNIIFGKWIQHTGWYPDYQMRLFRKDSGKFDEKHVHELLTLKGESTHLKNPLTHLNYESVSQFLDKMVRNYTVSEANALIEKGYKFKFSDIYLMPLGEFFSRYFARKGYKDGMHGLSISMLMAFYHFVVFLRLWEHHGFEKKDESLDIFSDGIKFAKKNNKYWLANEKIENESNIVKKHLFKVMRKVNS